MTAGFSTLLRMWHVAPMPAAATIGVLSLFGMPIYWLHYGLAHMISLGWRENLLQAVLQGALAGSAALYLFVKSIFFSLVPPFVLLIGWLILAETPTLLQVMGLTIVLGGFQLTQKG